MLQSVSPGNADSWNPANSRSPIQWHGHAHGHGDAIGDETGSDTFPEPLSDMSWLPSRTVTVTASPPLLLNPFNSPLNPYQDEDHANGNDRHCEYERKFNSNSEQVSQIETLTLSPNEGPILATGGSDSSISSLHSLSSSPSEFHSSSDLSILDPALASEAEGEILGAAGGLSVSPSVGTGTDGSVSGESESDGNLNGSGHGSAKSTHRHSKSSVRRLAAQMKYDKKRRVVQKVAFESLREGLQLAHMECQRVRQEAADLLQEESQDDQSDSNTTSLKEWETLAIQLQEGQRVTTIDLFRGAAEAISGLRRLKRALESKVQQLDSSQQVAQLLDNIQVVHKKYRAEMDAVRNIEISKQYLPRSLTDVSRIFEDMVVFTMDGTFIRAAPAPAPGPASGSNFARSSSPSELDQVDSENRILSSVYHLGRFSGRWGSAIIHQMHAIVSYCSNGAFLKQMRSQSQLKLSADNNRRELTTANVVQMLRDSADVSLSLSQPSQSSSSSSSSSSSASTSSLGGNDCPSAFSAYPSLESDLLRHPLGSCSCPPSCLYTFLQVVSSWLSWSEEEYYAQMDVIRDLAKSASTDDYVDSKVVWQEEFHAKGYSPKDMVFHPLSAAPYEWIPALYGLFSGQKSVITIPCFTRLKHAVVPIDMTIFCVKEPNTGMPLTLVYLLHSIRLDRPANFLVEEAAALERVRKNVANYNEKQSQMKWPC